MPVFIEILAQRAAIAILDMAIDALKKFLNEDETKTKQKP